MTYNRVTMLFKNYVLSFNDSKQTKMSSRHEQEEEIIRQWY
jgi:hypothetical protein